ncbi:MAG: TetR family transcriptional regulator [Actinobacteria bacterium]|nr:TetR family transcriptional regulator [Actinomycetota bacterium]
MLARTCLAPRGCLGMLRNYDGAQARMEDLPRRRRTARAIANDEAIRAAAIAVIVDSGWDAMTFSEVAKRANLTVGAVYGRAESKAELGADLWTSSLYPALSAGLAGLGETIASGSVPEVAQVLKSWSEPSDALQAATALAIAAIFDEDLHEVIGPDMAALLNAHCGLIDGRSGPSAAASALSIGGAFGRVLAARDGARPPVSGKQAAQREIDMSLARGRAQALPRLPVITFQRTPTTSDPHLDLLQIAALDVIGRVGYRRATVARICRLAQVSSGSMFARFESKADLVTSAASVMLVSHAEQTRALKAVSSSSGPAISNAMLLRAFLDPAAQGQRGLRLELARVSQHEPDLQGIDVLGSAAQHPLLGLGLVGSYAGEVARLPFVVPLAAARP